MQSAGSPFWGVYMNLPFLNQSDHMMYPPYIGVIINRSSNVSLFEVAHTPMNRYVYLIPIYLLEHAFYHFKHISLAINLFRETQPVLKVFQGSFVCTFSWKEIYRQSPISLLLTKKLISVIYFLSFLESLSPFQ